MRYGIRPDGVLERVALSAGVVPVPVIDVLVPLLKVRAIMAGVRLGIFGALAAEPQSSAELAASLELDPGCLHLLLRVLVGAEYLKADGDRFALSPLARRSLAPEAQSPLSAYVEFNYLQWHFVEGLDEALQSGRGVDFHRTLPQSSPAWACYQRAMLELCRPVLKTIVARVPVPSGARRLLDLGGSHGLIGAALCRAHPPLRSTVLELPAAVDPARRLAQAEGIADLVEHRAGDVTCCDYGGSYDVVLICNLLHHFSEREAELVLSRAVAALRPGGTIAVWETEMPSPQARPELAADALALYFRVTSSAGWLHPDELAHKLGGLGCEAVQTRRFLRAPGRVLLHARRAASFVQRS